jgi:hypothetical protein
MVACCYHKDKTSALPGSNEIHREEFRGRVSPSPSRDPPQVELSLPTHDGPAPSEDRRAIIPTSRAQTAAYSSTGGQAQTRLRSPAALFTRATCGQNFRSRTHSAGKAARSREYGWVHSSAVTAAVV